MKGNQEDHAHLAQRIRPYLLCLKQLESVYVLAGWILKLFLSILNRGAQHSSTADKELSSPALVTADSNTDESGFAFFLRTLPSSPLNADHIAQLSTPTSFDFT